MVWELLSYIMEKGYTSISYPPKVEQRGSGYDINSSSVAEPIVDLEQLYYVAMCLYLYASLSVKISLLIFLRRIFVKSLTAIHPLLAWMNWLTLAFQCDPARAAYDLTITNPSCYSQYKLFQIVLYQAVLIFVCDVIILIAPLVILCGLNLPTRKILALIVIFGSGVIACISPVVRFSTLDYLRNGTSDLTYGSSSSLYWMAIEFNLGLIAGSLSSLRPLPIFRRFGSSTNSQDKASTVDKAHELHNMNANEPRVIRKKSIGLGMGSTILQDSVNESQENIIYAPKGDYEQQRASF
ncbi:hypothetical protein PITC_058790 [Penicillium italicum]|uniref:Rhodopsin domain-containing protein n=1 Tax=Penicillium italicum TaxID=40296 RepID=A0A0A2LGE1_PENIT|nr:hypothetical protein PITC_058790 [Penicillium italicum]